MSFKIAKQICEALQLPEFVQSFSTSCNFNDPIVKVEYVTVLIDENAELIETLHKAELVEKEEEN